MQCPQCRHPNSATANYCANCRAPLTAPVAVVQTAVPPTALWLRRGLTRLHGPTVLWSAAAGGLGGLLGWVLGEAVNPLAVGSVYLAVFLYFAAVSALLGAVLGALPGVLNRSRPQALRGALAGAIVAGIGGGLGALPAQYMYMAMGYGTLARAVGWAIAGACVGLCPGVATRDPRRALRGLGGGLVGGFIAGLLFDLVGGLIPTSPTDTGTASRFVANIVLGICIGVMLAFVEVVARNAWLKVLSGKREGYQFILSKTTTAIGRDDRDDVLLWGDSQLALHHARITRNGHGYLLESLTLEAPTLLNGWQVGGPTSLHDGDELTLGATKMLFQARDVALTPGVVAPPALPRGTGGGRRRPGQPPPPGVAPPALPPIDALPVRSTPLSAPPSTSAAPTRAALLAAAAPAGQGDIAAHFRLLALAPLKGGHALPERPVLRVGRAPDNDIALAGDTVSAYHAELRWENGQWVVYDMGSTNGTHVSFSGAPAGERPVQRNALRAGSTVRFGEARFRLERDFLLGGEGTWHTTEALF